MKIVVTGSLGNVGKPLVENLVKEDHSVIVISRNPDLRKDIEDLGATAAIGSVKDMSFLKKVFTSADAAFCMIPPDYSEPDQVGHYRSIAESYAKATEGSTIKKVVHLSSWGADLNEGTGFILGSHFSENILNTIPNVSITHLRAGFIYYNLFQFIDMIKHAGFMASNYGEDDKIVMVAPVDIAAAAAEELTNQTIGNKIRYIASEDRTANDVAHILGNAIGKPDLQWKRLSKEEMMKNMEQNGMPQHTIENVLALNESIRNGNLRKDYDKSGYKTTGKIKLEDFAKEFIAAYNKNR